MSKHLVPTDLINEFLAYLATKAYSEVNGLIAKFHQQSVLYEEPGAPVVAQSNATVSELASDVAAKAKK